MSPCPVEFFNSHSFIVLNFDATNITSITKFEEKMETFSRLGLFFINFSDFTIYLAMNDLS